MAHRDILGAYEIWLRASDEGARICENAELGLTLGLTGEDRFFDLCERLGPLLVPPFDTCNREAILLAVDQPTPLYCQGPKIEAEADLVLSRITDVRGLARAQLSATRDDEPHRSDVEEATENWRLSLETGAVVKGLDLTLRGERPFYWATSATALAAAGTVDADELRDLLGLGHVIARRLLVEVRLPSEQAGPLHRPTLLDALDNPSFYPAAGPNGWGLTDDLRQPARTPGLPEVVAASVTARCDIAPRGETTRDAARW